jgi:hypothetical protein
VNPDHLDIEEHQMPDPNMGDGLRFRLRPQPPQTWPTVVAEKFIQQLLCVHQFTVDSYFIHRPLESNQPRHLSTSAKISVHSFPLRRTITRLFIMGGTNAQFSVGKVSLSGHTARPRALHRIHQSQPEYSQSQRKARHAQTRITR